MKRRTSDAFMNKVILIAGLVVFGGAILYFVTKGSPAQAPGSEEQVLREVMVNLREQNESGMSGTAVFTETNGRVRVVLNLTGAPQGVVQPAHIHANSCADIGGVKYPLTFPLNGSSETMLEVSLDEILAGLPLAVNVHKSAAEALVYVACGDIVMP